MPIVLLMGIFVVVAVGAAELVRVQCRRMLTTPVRRRPRPARPAHVSPAARVSSMVGAAESATIGYATASAA
jgi:hypothetical protein